VKQPLSRRGLLKSMAAPGSRHRASMGSGACARLPGPAVWADHHLQSRRPAVPRRPAGVDTLPKIRHIVVVMMENHSFDNYFGMLGRAMASPSTQPGSRRTPTRALTARLSCLPLAVGLSVRRGHLPDWVVSHTSWNHARTTGSPWPRGRHRWAITARQTCPSTTRSGAPSRSATGGSARRWPRPTRTAAS